MEPLWKKLVSRQPGVYLFISAALKLDRRGDVDKRNPGQMKPQSHKHRGEEGPQSAGKNKRQSPQKEAAVGDSQKRLLSLCISKKDMEHRSPGKQVYSAERSPCD
ncbi:hypothetical protein STEG23_019725 [Scotinomys teguina]